MPEYNYNDLMLAQQARIQDTQKLQQEDSDKWEMDTDSILDVLYHTWLGQKLNKGVWVDAPELTKLMNEKGASFIISEIRPRFNINMQFSVFDEQRIRTVVGDTGINIVRVLKYDYWKYDIKPNHIINICDQVTHALDGWLRIALMGGMRAYKGDKTKTVINKQETNVTGGGAF